MFDFLRGSAKTPNLTGFCVGGVHSISLVNLLGFESSKTSFRSVFSEEWFGLKRTKNIELDGI